MVGLNDEFKLSEILTDLTNGDLLLWIVMVDLHRGASQAQHDTTAAH